MRSNLRMKWSFRVFLLRNKQTNKQTTSNKEAKEWKKLCTFFVWIDESAALKNNKNDPLCVARTALPVQNRSLFWSKQHLIQSRGKNTCCCSPYRHNNMKSSKWRRQKHQGAAGCCQMYVCGTLWWQKVGLRHEGRAKLGQAHAPVCPLQPWKCGPSIKSYPAS